MYNVARAPWCCIQKQRDSANQQARVGSKSPLEIKSASVGDEMVAKAIDQRFSRSRKVNQKARGCEAAATASSLSSVGRGLSSPSSIPKKPLALKETMQGLIGFADRFLFCV